MVPHYVDSLKSCSLGTQAKGLLFLTMQLWLFPVLAGAKIAILNSADLNA